MKQIHYISYLIKEHIQDIKNEPKYIKNILISFDLLVFFYCAWIVSVILGVSRSNIFLYCGIVMTIYCPIAVIGGAIVCDAWDDIKDSYNEWEKKR
jgi:hypothetical protein